MSFADQLVLWLHIGVAVFTIGPVTLAISSTPRYIRKRDAVILRYLARTTMIFTIGALAVLVLGIVLGQLLHEFSKPWLTAALTLFLVAIVLLILIMSDQRKAIRAVEEAAALQSSSGQAMAASDQNSQEALSGSADAAQSATIAAAHLASVERGRIAAMGGIVNLIWLAVLALMVWQP